MTLPVRRISCAKGEGEKDGDDFGVGNVKKGKERGVVAGYPKMIDFKRKRNPLKIGSLCS